MTDAGDVLGLRGVLPGPGWHVLDAARTHRFTGELVMHADVDVRVYLDRGLIYTAERSTDPSLGSRLVEAGAIDQAQLEHGTLRVGEIEHLGRLFERVPSINRDGVLVVNQLMTDECIRSVAREHVAAVDVTPYRHHPSGMHRWDVIREVEATLASDVPHMALPAPAPDARPVSAPPPTAFRDTPAGTSEVDTADEALPQLERREPYGDDTHGDHQADHHEREHRVEHQDDHHEREHPFDPFDPFDVEAPADALFDDLVRWDEPSRVDPGTTLTPRRAERAVADPFSDDWIDRLTDHGIEHAPVGAPVGRLAPVAVRAQDRFEMVWPSGETTDVVADETHQNRCDGDADRAGPTARIGGAPTVEAPAPTIDEPTGSDLAIRRAVATIDTGSLEARRRLVDAGGPTTDVAVADLPGRLAMRSEHIARASTAPTSPTSVFDQVPLAPPPAELGPEPAPHADRHGRAGALRRLIGHLRGD